MFVVAKRKTPAGRRARACKKHGLFTCSWAKEGLFSNKESQRSIFPPRKTVEGGSCMYPTKEGGPGMGGRTKNKRAAPRIKSSAAKSAPVPGAGGIPNGDGCAERGCGAPAMAFCGHGDVSRAENGQPPMRPSDSCRATAKLKKTISSKGEAMSTVKNRLSFIVLFFLTAGSCRPPTRWRRPSQSPQTPARAVCRKTDTVLPPRWGCRRCCK